MIRRGASPVVVKTRRRGSWHSLNRATTGPLVLVLFAFASAMIAPRADRA